MYRKSIKVMVFLILSLVFACVFYYFANKRISYPEGYTIIQANRFYRSCIAEGVNSRQKMKQEDEKIEKILEKNDFIKNKDLETIWMVYSEGLAAEKIIGKKGKKEK